MSAREPFIALVIYPTTPDAQERQADNLARMTGESIRVLPGFLGGRVLVSEDGRSLVTLTEWRDRESFEGFRQSDFGRAAVVLTAGLNPQAYWLRTRALVTPP